MKLLTENKKMELLKKLKKVHDVYQTCTNEQKIRLFEASTLLVEELETMGYSRIVLESLLMWGGEFWKAELKSASDDELDKVFEG